jgi:hypothetical protein
MPCSGQYDPAGAFWAANDPRTATNVPAAAGVMLLDADALTKYPGTA